VIQELLYLFKYNSESIGIQHVFIILLIIYMKRLFYNKNKKK